MIREDCFTWIDLMTRSKQNKSTHATFSASAYFDRDVKWIGCQQCMSTRWKKARQRHIGRYNSRNSSYLSSILVKSRLFGAWCTMKRAKNNAPTAIHTSCYSLPFSVYNTGIYTDCISVLLLLMYVCMLGNKRRQRNVRMHRERKHLVISLSLLPIS